MSFAKNTEPYNILIGLKVIKRLRSPFLKAFAPNNKIKTLNPLSTGTNSNINKVLRYKGIKLTK